MSISRLVKSVFRQWHDCKKLPNENELVLIKWHNIALNKTEYAIGYAKYFDDVKGWFWSIDRGILHDTLLSIDIKSDKWKHY